MLLRHKSSHDQQPAPAGKAAEASLRIVSPELDPQQITKLLGMSPDIAYRQGGSFKRKSREIRAKTGMWLVSTAGKIHSSNPNVHLAAVLDVIEPYVDSLKRTPNLEIVFSVFWRNEKGGKPGLCKSLLKDARNIGRLELDVDDAVEAGSIDRNAELTP